MKISQNHLFKSLLLSAASLVLTGCGTAVVKAPPGPIDSDAVALQKWSNVLRRHVNEAGQISFRALATEPTDLFAYVRYISKVSPTATPERFSNQAERLAYYLNSYNALAMFNVINSGFPLSLSSLNAKAQFFYFRSFIIGGETMSLYDYENKVIRAEGDARVHFALNCMSIGCPRLPRAPFLATQLDAQLERETFDFFGELRYLNVDNSNKIVHVSEILDFYPEDFLANHASLIDYINQYQETPIPTDYKVKFIPYDWTVNYINSEKFTGPQNAERIRNP
ncbi:MAG: DUF547 domain-containing protein [Pseudomonadota bacterium]